MLENLNSIPHDLIISIKLIYDPGNFDYSRPVTEKESAEYGACTFKVNNLSVKFRVANITPKKVGQFVTIWKRTGNGPIEPFDIADDLDLVIISVRKNEDLGQFVFPKSVLNQKGIISGNNKPGKRGIRVYAPWDKPTSRQAAKTQEWQLDYFMEIRGEQPGNLNLARKLFTPNNNIN
jgi:hypothetical protein